MGSSYMGFNQISKEDFEEVDFLFKQFMPDREIWLFGVGKYARSFCRFMQMCGGTVEGFVVSDISSCPQVFMGKKVLSRASFRKYYERETGDRKKKIGLLLTVDSKYLGDLYPALMYLKKDLYVPKQLYLQYAAEHCGTENSGIELCFPIVDYCSGIACYGCTAGAPIAERKIYELSCFEEDISSLYQVLGKRVDRINFTGGDVFLHPQLAEMTEVVRKYYPRAFLSFSVNGVGLDRQEDRLWERLGKCDITLFWTLYPIKYPDYGDTVEKIRKLGRGGIEIVVQGDSGGEGKSSWKIPFDMNHTGEKHDWLFCRLHKCSHNMLVVRDGTIRTCFAIRLHDNLKSRFGDRMTPVFRDIIKSGNNDIQISDIHTAKEIVEFMMTRIPLCDYCAIRERHSLNQWRPSCGDMSEWFV